MYMKKEFGLLEVFSIASGAMISSGLFILPAIIYRKAGPSIILAYIFASILIIPAMFSKAELATAMPKSGGDYFFIHRSFGPLLGTFAGMASWFSISLKSAFALLGIGVFGSYLLKSSGIIIISNVGLVSKLIAIGFILFFTILNILSSKESGKFQVVLVIGLLIILIFYILRGFSFIEVNRYVPFLKNNWNSVFVATGMIFVSFAGLTKIAAIAEEIKNPNENIPKGMFSSFTVVSIIYIICVFVTIGVINKTNMHNSVLPLSEGAKIIYGTKGFWALTIAAMLAFITTGNAGLIAASRAPMAMAKDFLLPRFLEKVNSKTKTPISSIIITSSVMLFFVIFLDLEDLVKVASTMKLILFALVNISVIIMRESKISSYKPSFFAPLYPLSQIFGTIIYLFLIVQMGSITLTFTFVFFLLSLICYFLYSKPNSEKNDKYDDQGSALIRLVERITSKEIKTSRLGDELREILIERDEIIEDRFDEIIKNAQIFDLDGKFELKDFLCLCSKELAKRSELEEDDIYKLLLEREIESPTVIKEGLAIPHLVIPGKNLFEIMVFRCKEGIHFGSENKIIKTIFVLAGTKDERNFHLKVLMSIAQIVSEDSFEKRWLEARNENDLKNIILTAKRKREVK